MIDQQRPTRHVKERANVPPMIGHGYIKHIEPTCVVEHDPGEVGPVRPLTAAARARLSEETLTALAQLRAGTFPLMSLAGRA